MILSPKFKSYKKKKKKKLAPDILFLKLIGLWTLNILPKLKFDCYD